MGTFTEIRSWYKTGSNKPVANPRSNPAYCFNWSFGGNGEPVVACLWHGNLMIEADEIVYADNLREHAKNLQQIANALGEEPDIRNRAQTQARRAIALDAALAWAWANKGIVRVIVNEGLQRPADSLGQESSKVEMRKLDTVTWHAGLYDEASGNLRLIRDGNAGLSNTASAGQLATPVVPVESTFIIKPPVVRFADVNFRH